MKSCLSGLLLASVGFLSPLTVTAAVAENQFLDMELTLLSMRAQEFPALVDENCQFETRASIYYSKNGNINNTVIQYDNIGSGGGSTWAESKYIDPVSRTEFRVTFEDVDDIQLSKDCSFDSVLFDKYTNSWGQTYLRFAKHVYYKLNITGFNANQYADHDNTRYLQSVQVTGVFPDGTVKTANFSDMTGSWLVNRSIKFNYGHYNTGEYITRVAPE
ncbi:hypothetical protein [Microbulbifer epialgicus]|uniref:Uncharacterized protein n=1 Tax=Microbulbifer epialgicus TaxID=393907 RepID=A0ABV4P1N5_9GAMM